MKTCGHCGAKTIEDDHIIVCDQCKIVGHNGWSFGCEICHPNGIGAINESFVKGKYQDRFGKKRKRPSR